MGFAERDFMAKRVELNKWNQCNLNRWKIRTVLWERAVGYRQHEENHCILAIVILQKYKFRVCMTILMLTEIQ